MLMDDLAIKLGASKCVCNTWLINTGQHTCPDPTIETFCSGGGELAVCKCQDLAEDRIMAAAAQLRDDPEIPRVSFLFPTKPADLRKILSLPFRS